MITIKNPFSSIPSLQIGDRVGIISTARKISSIELQPAIEKLQSWGLQVELGKNIFAEYHQFAGTDLQRAEDLQTMLDNSQIRAIFCARGGYGTSRIIDQIDFSRFRQSPKWIVGYSDVTVLHAHIQRFGYESIHATMPINFPVDGKDNSALITLHEALFQNQVSHNFKGESYNFQKEFSAPMVGGNLSILYSLAATPSDIETEGKILFIEDLDEYLYHIDRMMMNLKRAGKLENLAALLVGGMSDMHDNSVPFGSDAKEIILQHVADFPYPVVFDFPAGHIPDNRAVILGRKATIQNEQSQIRFIQ
ncbi:MAG: LD-carboxypeptidase [Bacteroidales bacterium]|nr:LD-carboxypeptidase [Bacteroidales bacterium]